ncbi:hypothetical protein MTR67_002036, partial [Solanum verrucosum]
GTHGHHPRTVDGLTVRPAGGTHGHHPRTVDGLTVRPAGPWFVTENFPELSQKIWLNVDPRPDLRSVSQVTDRSSCPWINALKAQLQYRTTVDQHGPSFDPRSVGLTVDRRHLDLLSSILLLQLLSASILNLGSVASVSDHGGVKNENVHYHRLLQPLPIPRTPRQDIAMDFIEGLPSSRHKNTTFVVVDRLTKYEQFSSLKHRYKTQDVAEVFLNEVHKLHGLPKIIVSDRDSIFRSLSLFSQVSYGCICSNPWALSYNCLHLITLNRMAGQTERLNRCLETYLRAMNFQIPNSRSNGFTFGRVVRIEGGALVCLKLQPYRQTSIAVRKNLKLSSKYYGPYRVIKRIGSVSYQLELPQGSQIHPIFHVLQLKKRIGSIIIAHQQPPT